MIRLQSSIAIVVVQTHKSGLKFARSGRHTFLNEVICNVDLPSLAGRVSVVGFMSWADEYVSAGFEMHPSLILSACSV